MPSLDETRQELSAIGRQTEKPYNVNFFCHTQAAYNQGKQSLWQRALKPYYAELGLAPPTNTTTISRSPFSAEHAAILAEFQPAVLSFHFGLPKPSLLEQVRRWGAKILASATTLEEALWLERCGVDAVIAQVLEAGGHRGMFLTTDLDTQIGRSELVAQLVEHLTIPVIAAGGIAGAESVAACLAQGAAGVQVGTAYLLCPKTKTSPLHRAAIQTKPPHPSAISNVFSGRPAHGIVNRLMREIGPISPLAPSFPWASAALAPLHAQAERQGSEDFSPLWAGESHSQCQEISASVLTRELASWLPYSMRSHGMVGG